MDVLEWENMISCPSYCNYLTDLPSSETFPLKSLTQGIHFLVVRVATYLHHLSAHSPPHTLGSVQIIKEPEHLKVLLANLSTEHKKNFSSFETRSPYAVLACPRIYCVEQTDLELRNLPASNVLGLKVCTSMPGSGNPYFIINLRGLWLFLRPHP